MPVRIPPNPLHRRLWTVGIVAVVAAAAIVGWRWYVDFGQCADGVDKVGDRDECVGITDGSYVFHESLRDVVTKIRDENRRVVEQGDKYVNIAYFEPMTLIDNDITRYDLVRHSLQGAYLSQRRANHTDQWAGKVPLVRLLLANPGSQAQHWEHVVNRIEQLHDSKTDAIHAVAGLGQSVDGTVQAVNRLSVLDVPMVGSVITADSFSDVEGLARVVPTNTDEVNAIVAHLSKDTRRALLVRDTNTDDDFAVNLAETFERLYPREGRILIHPDEEFESSNEANNLFQTVAPEICAAKPDVIFFAGRFRDLIRFLDKVADRRCPDVAIRVVTGDSISDLTGDERIRNSLRFGITLEYVHLADHHAWDLPGAGQLFGGTAYPYFTQDRGAGYFRHEFPGDSFDDGLAVLAFDAVGTAVSGLRLDGFNELRGKSAVGGASGLISLLSGDPDRKVMSLLTLSAMPGDAITSVRRSLTSCTGEPFQVRGDDGPDPVRCPKQAG